jgi:hypothetical protein
MQTVGTSNYMLHDIVVRTSSILHGVTETVIPKEPATLDRFLAVAHVERTPAARQIWIDELYRLPSPCFCTLFFDQAGALGNG